MKRNIVSESLVAEKLLVSDWWCILYALFGLFCSHCGSDSQLSCEVRSLLLYSSLGFYDKNIEAGQLKIRTWKALSKWMNSCEKDLNKIFQCDNGLKWVKGVLSCLCVSVCLSVSLCVCSLTIIRQSTLQSRSKWPGWLQNTTSGGFNEKNVCG